MELITVAETIKKRIEELERSLRRRGVQPWALPLIHAECNGHLTTLRSGCRRHNHHQLRERIRRVRAAVAAL